MAADSAGEADVLVVTVAAGEQQVPATAIDEWAWTPGASRLPGRADIVIVGGGIVGCSAAWFLARAGVSVLLCEKGRVSGEQSGRNWGWVRQQGRSPLELPLMMQSLAIWRELGAETGEDVGFTQGGCLYLAEDDAELAAHAAFLPVAREHGLDTRLLAAGELAAVLEGSGRRWRGALYTPSDGRAEPGRAAPAIARAAARAGATIVTQCAVRGVELAAGRVERVVTEHGAVRAGAVVCAAGAWSSMFSRPLGVAMPQLRVKGTVARTAPAARITDGTAFSHRVAIRRRADGGYTVAHGAALEHSLGPATLRFAGKFLPAFRQERGAVRLRIDGESLREFATPARWPLDRPSPFERERVLAPAPSAAILAEVRAGLARCFPQLAQVPLVETWGGMIETSPDVLPVISPAAGIDGYYVATGFSGHGFGIGPAAGRLVADMVTGRAATGALAPFRLGRFFDGSPIRPGPTL